MASQWEALAFAGSPIFRELRPIGSGGEYGSRERWRVASAVRREGMNGFDAWCLAFAASPRCLRAVFYLQWGFDGAEVSLSMLEMTGCVSVEGSGAAARGCERAAAACEGSRTSAVGVALGGALRLYARKIRVDALLAVVLRELRIDDGNAGTFSGQDLGVPARPLHALCGWSSRTEQHMGRAPSVADYCHMMLAL